MKKLNIKAGSRSILRLPLEASQPIRFTLFPKTKKGKNLCA